MPVSSTDFDLALRAALWSGEAAALLSVGLIAWILVLRARLKTRAVRTHAFLAAWRPILAEATLVAEYAGRLPAFHRRDLEPFLREWNAVHDTVTSASKRGLNALVGRLGIGGDVRALLAARRVPARALGIAAAGHLRDPSAWDALVKELDSGSHVLSLLAARALVEIEPAAAIGEILPRVASQPRWPAGRVAALFHLAGPDVVGPPLCAAILEAPPERAVRLLPFINEAPAPLAAETLEALLHDEADERVVAACLKALRHPVLLPLARRYLAHPQWFIRLLAVEAVGRTGGPNDVERMEALLSDEQWWVRYRAAQALVRLPWLAPGDLDALRSRQQDRFAQEILDQAIAELRFR